MTPTGYTIEDIRQAKRDGRQEVVEWFREQTEFDDDDLPYYVMNKNVWQAQVKKWGIE